MFNELTLQQPTTTISNPISNPNSNPNSNPIDNDIEKGLDFILSHFEQYITFPRNIMTTELIDGKKYHHFKIVNSKEEALVHFKKYNYVDCRINAFPCLKEDVLWKPELLFIDLDLVDFKSKPNPKKSLDLALSKTIKNIKEKLHGSESTVLNSGNGLHVIQPVECPESVFPLERVQQFSKYDKPSEQFLRFAKDILSNGKADKQNYPSFNSCWLRVPGSINSKCLDNREKRLSGNIKVKVLQNWNGYRPVITRELLYDFHTYLNQKKAIERKKSNNKKYYIQYNQNSYNNNEIYWIEKLLLIPIKIPRRICVDLIFVPYFILVKGLSEEETTSKITEWLQQCNSLRKLDFDIKYKIKTAIKHTNKTRIPPMKKSTLKDNYSELYQVLKDKGF
jgi:hypothetical protein